MSAFARTTLPSLWFAAILLGANPASAFLAFVSNEKGNSISVVDTDKMDTVATIPTGQRPRGISRDCAWSPGWNTFCDRPSRTPRARAPLLSQS